MNFGFRFTWEQIIQVICFKVYFLSNIKGMCEYFLHAFLAHIKFSNRQQAIVAQKYFTESEAAKQKLGHNVRKTSDFSMSLKNIKFS